MRYRFKPAGGDYEVQYRCFLFFWFQSSFGRVPAREATRLVGVLRGWGDSIAGPVPQ